MKITRTILAALAVLIALNAAAVNPKREFRGAWMHIIGQEQYAKMTTAETQTYLIDQLDKLKKAGCNAIIWQVRPQSDAAYKSDLEPWSKWITGVAGKAPVPEWDPLQFMIEESHKRGMELHAWINPYRVTTNKTEMPPKGHIYYQHPEWFLKYADGKLYFDPGLPECRDFIDKVVRDMVTRYDVDAIHMDDYFYPYPVEGVAFPDTASYKKYGQGWELGDWRRHNVDVLIEQLHNTLVELKPWVRLGISPFGIWRNKKSDSNGSETSGLECYDALYADCPRWTAMGWVDYMVPQLYWELEHKRASDLTLGYWWDQHANGRHMYQGQNVANIMSHQDIAADKGDVNNPTQLDHKMRLMRDLPNTQGMCWWPGYTITGNHKGVMDSLVNKQQAHPALIQPYTWIDKVAPGTVTGLNVKKDKKEVVISWNAPRTQGPMQEAARYVVYMCKKGETLNTEAGDQIIDITGETSLRLPVKSGKWQYGVTAVDRCGNESAPAIIEL